MGKVRKVLIVEDEVLVRYGLKSAIDWKKLDMEIIGDAANGKQALEIYEKNRPDIILTDIKMPIMDGLEMISNIREKDQDTQIVILTCYEEFIYLQSAMRLGVCDYISKLKMRPVEIEAAMTKIKAQLDRKEAKIESSPQNELLKEEVITQYMFYHQIPGETFRSKMEKLNLAIEEKNLILCRLALHKYEDAQKRMNDSQGRLTSFMVKNIVGDVVDSYGKGELIQEKDHYFLLLMNMKDDSEESFIRLDVMLRKISQALKELLDVQAVWSVSSIGQSWKELYEMYQECCRKMEEETRQLSVEIDKAVKYIKEHLNEKLTLAQVAEQIKLSPNYLSSLFKKELQVSFVDYITECRVEKAKDLLMHTDMKTCEVAESTGFSDESYFSKTFKKITGKRPSAFRKRII